MLLIRTAQWSDARSLGEIHVSSWQAAYEHLLPAEKLSNLSISDRASQWNQILDHAAEGTLVAESEGRILGFASSGPSRDPDATPGYTSELYALYVAPEHWNKGVGWRLWHSASLRLNSQRYTEATLWVLEGNERARTFYERVGFTLDPEARETVELLGATLPEVRYRIRLV